MTTPRFPEIVPRALLFVLGMAIGLVAVCDDLPGFDEPMVLVGAERILHGEIPLRDFYAHYPPAQYFVVAGLLKVFGRSAMPMRVYCIAVRALIALVLYAMARRLVPRRLALAAWLAAMVWLSFCGFYGYTTFPALLLTLIGLTFLARGAEPHDAGMAATPLPMLAAGAALGAAALFRHDLAAYGLLAGLPCAGAVVARGFAASAPGSSRRLIGALRPLWPFVAGMGLLFGPPAAWLLAVVPFREVVFELFTYPATIYALVRGIPYPALVPVALGRQVLTDPARLAEAFGNIAFYSAPAFIVLGVIVWASRIRAGGRAALLDSGNLRLATLVLFDILVFNLVRVRSDQIHLIAMLVVSYAVGAVVLHAIRAGRRFWRLSATAALILVWTASLVSPLFVGLSFARFDVKVLTSREPPTFGTTCCGALPEWEAAAAYIRSVVPPGERIFVGCGRHDAIFVNEPILYWLADRLPGTKYHVLDPGIATTLDVQRDIVADLIRHHVKYVVLSTVLDHESEANLSSVSTGVTYLDRYLRAHYRVERNFGPYYVCAASDPGPAAPASP